MKLDMSALNVKNFSYYAFNPKAPSLSDRDKKIVILAQVFLSLTLGLGHAISAIIYAARFGDFQDGLVKLANAANSTNRLALAGFKLNDISEISIRGTLPQDQYVCQIEIGNVKSKINLQEAELKKILKTKEAFVSDPCSLLDDAKFNINSSSRISRSPSFEMFYETDIEKLDFSKIACITVMGMLSNLLQCVILDKNGQKDSITLSIQDLEKIIQNNLAKVEDPLFFKNTSKEQLLNEIQNLTGINLSAVDNIKVTQVQEGRPFEFSCDIFYSNGGVHNLTLSEYAFKRIFESGLVKVDTLLAR